MKKSFLSLSLIIVFNFFLLNTISADIRMLYNTNFQDWTGVSNPTTETSIVKTTSFSNESFSFKLLRMSVIPDKYDASKFNYSIASTGAIMAEKLSAATDANYIETTPLKSITKIFVVIGATGSNRGFIIQKKADGDANWVDIYSAVANPANGDSTTITIPGGQTNVALKFTNLAYSQNAYLLDLQIFGEYASSAPQKKLTTSINISEAGTITKDPISLTYDENSQVSLLAKRNFGYEFENWIDSLSNTILSIENPYVFSMNSDKHIQAVFHKINTYELKFNVEGGAKDYMITVSPVPNVIDQKKMYEQGALLTLSAGNNPVCTFNNWGTGETNPIKTVTMDADNEITAVYSAVDFIAGWDFYMTGNSSRSADFYSNADNQASTLILRNADGIISSWLDKSQLAAAGYEGKPAAVNWSPLANKNYYQISFNATDFTDISVSSSMLLNYNAYSVQNVEYSIDGTNFTKLGVIELPTAKVWNTKLLTLPSVADHAAMVYVRWIPDYTSAIVGSTATNDGTAISEIYVFGATAVLNDGVAPVLSSSVPAANATGASTTGKIVLTFDEKVQVADGTMAYLGSKLLSPAVSGKTLTFAYTGLDYNTEYTFSLGENNVSDLGGNKISSKIEFKFTTMNRPVVNKKSFDFVVGVDGDFKAAMQAAQAASASGNRFYIFLPNGEYNIGENTGDANQMTTVSLPNLSIVGQSGDNVIVYNKSIQESINSTATMYFTSAANNTYMQDISLMNKMDYRTGNLIGRGVALWDKGTKNIYKNVNLLSNQDTYYSGDGRLYFEGGSIHGTVDFICGGGDVFFNECLIYLEERSGNMVTAPSTSSDWGYVFNSCTIDGFSVNNNSYKLGRPWSNAPKAIYINTTMNVLPAASGWGDPMNVVPAVFAEYNSVTSNGSAVDLSNRRTDYTKDAISVTLNPVLTTGQAATYTIENVLGGTDAWQPKLYTDQAATPGISATANVINWDDNNYTLCWAVFKNGAFVQFVTTNSYTIPANSATGSLFTVRAANEMGGLGEVSNVLEFNQTGLVLPTDNASIVSENYFTIDGRKLQNLKGFKGSVIVRTLYSNGKIITNKIMKTEY
ncbi:MAG: pectinesterase family protein [Paludibacter sp.]|nr:pectinesterase family protein [Paludibacter sp.]